MVDQSVDCSEARQRGLNPCLRPQLREVAPVARVRGHAIAAAAADRHHCAASPLSAAAIGISPDEAILRIGCRCWVGVQRGEEVPAGLQPASARGVRSSGDVQVGWRGGPGRSDVTRGGREEGKARTAYRADRRGRVGG